MKQELYRNYLLSEDWKMIREAYLRKVGYKCEKCSSTRNIQVHHLSYGEDLNFVKDKDLMAVCRQCHNYLHQDLECFEKETHTPTLPVELSKSNLGDVC